MKSGRVKLLFMSVPCLPDSDPCSYSQNQHTGTSSQNQELVPVVQTQLVS